MNTAYAGHASVLAKACHQMPLSCSAGLGKGTWKPPGIVKAKLSKRLGRSDKKTSNDNETIRD